MAESNRFTTQTRRNNVPAVYDIGCGPNYVILFARMLGLTTKVVLGDIANRVLAADHYHMIAVVGERNDEYEQGRESKRK